MMDNKKNKKLAEAIAFAFVKTLMCVVTSLFMIGNMLICLLAASTKTAVSIIFIFFIFSNIIFTVLYIRTANATWKEVKSWF